MVRYKYVVKHPIMLPKKIWQYAINGELVATWKSLHEIQAQTVWNLTNISACCNKRAKTAYGYVWSFAELKPEDIAKMFVGYWKRDPNRKTNNRKPKNQNNKPTKNTQMSPYLKYVKYLYWKWRDYNEEASFLEYVCGKILGELPSQFGFIFNIGRGFTMYNARNLLYKCTEPEVKRFRKYLENVEMSVAAATFKMADWRGVVDAVMRTVYEEWKYARPVANVGHRNNIPIAAINPETLKPIAVFASRQEAIGVTGNVSIANSEKFGSTVAGAKWQKHADYLAGKPLPTEKKAWAKPYENNPFDYGINSLV